MNLLMWFIRLLRIYTNPWTNVGDHSCALYLSCTPWYYEISAARMNQAMAATNIGLQFLARGLSIHMKSAGFHEILGHSPHLAFIKLKSFAETLAFIILGWISQVKFGWNPPDFMVEIHQISGWNPLDF